MAETHGQRAQRAFGPELAKISDQRIKDFVIRCFDTICPDYFWERAASKRGVYHPKFVDGVGGLVRHVKYGCFWLDQFCRAFNGSGQNDDKGPLDVYDSAMAAMIMHDMVKDGDDGRTIPKSPHKISGYHGVEMMDAIWVRVLDGKLEFPEQALIMFGVAAHMGVWTNIESFRPWNIKGALARKVATLVHMADYAASRKVDEVIPALTGFMP
jgi:hypothetical protein